MRSLTVALGGLFLAPIGAACDGEDISDNQPAECEDGTVIEGVCVPLQCGDGAFVLDGECVGHDPDDTAAPTAVAIPPGGAYRAIPPVVSISADEPSIIYYTTDGFEPTEDSESAIGTALITGLSNGDELRYFAVDLTGNASEIGSDTYVIDLDAPGPVSNLSASRAGNNVDISWDNPDDIEGVLVARGRLGIPPRSAPSPGVIYEPGDTLPGGEAIILAEVATATDDLLTKPGFTIYAAWTYDAAGNYSEVRYSRPVGDDQLPAQTGTLSVDLSSGDVTVTSQPAHLTLSATANYDGDTILIDLNVQNDTNRILNNLKAVLDSVNDGTGVGEIFDGNVFWSYGARGLASGTSRSRALELTDVAGGTDPVVVTLDFLTHPVLLANHDVLDSSGATPEATDTVVSGRETGIAVDPLSRFAVYAARNRSAVQILDLATHSLSSISLFEFGHVGGVAVTHKHIYVAASKGGHRHAGDGGNGGPGSADAMDVWLYVFDLNTLAEVATIELVSSSGDLPMASEIALAPDGSVLAVLVSHWNLGTNELFLVDAQDLTVIDTDTASAGTQNVALTSNYLAESVVWQSSGQRIFVGFSNFLESAITGPNGGDGATPPDIDVVDASTYEVTQLSPANGGLSTGRMAFGGGRLYYPNFRGANPDQLTIFDIDGNSQMSLSTTDLGLSAVRSVAVDPGGDRYYVSGSGSDCGGAILNTSDDQLRTEEFDDLCPGRHSFAITPF